MSTSTITIASFNDTLKALLDSNAHARNKGDEFKAWCTLSFRQEARISHIKEQRQTTNRVSEQFRYDNPIVVFVCDPVVKRDVLTQYVLDRAYANLENVAIIGATDPKGDGNYVYTYERLIVFKRTEFTIWASSFFGNVKSAKAWKRVGSQQNSSNTDTMQVIYYGAPGTGKSYNIDKFLKEELIPDDHVKRVIFHPDYTYSDFIGGISPVTDPSNKPTYKYVAGPFLELLKKAFEAPTERFFMIIEEINRGNPAAIFGDVFQLLDRESNGESKYAITNADACEYLRGQNAAQFADDSFKLPANLNILCTMNTADQNVFVLDSAFKRRFTMEYVPIDFSSSKGNPKPAYLTALSECFSPAANNPNGDVNSLFANTTLATFLQGANPLPRNWQSFATLVNKKIDVINGDDETISEDKKLGPFFVTEDDLSDRKRFADKVLYYLKQDVFKYTSGVLSPSYQELYDRYVNKKEDIFEIFAKS